VVSSSSSARRVGVGNQAVEGQAAAVPPLEEWSPPPARFGRAAGNREHRAIESVQRVSRDAALFIGVAGLV
jgi:hypothetical protein